jgi:hypothetical protein
MHWRLQVIFKDLSGFVLLLVEISQLLYSVSLSSPLMAALVDIGKSAIIRTYDQEQHDRYAALTIAEPPKEHACCSSSVDHILHAVAYSKA